MENKVIKVEFHHSESGFCKNVYRQVEGNDKGRYFNQDTVSMEWYTCYPSKDGYYESDTPVRKDIVFEIVE